VVSAAVSRQSRVLVVVPPEDVKDGVLEADGLQQTLVPAAPAPTAAVGAPGGPHRAITTGAVVALSTALDAVGGGDETRPAACPEDYPMEPLRESHASIETLLRE
jgi:hypothetical protein